MKRLTRLAAVSLLLASTALAQTAAVIVPGDNLVVEGVPAIPATIADEVRRYTEFRSAGISSWHPTRREMLIGTRFGDTNQVHLVRTPGGARTQLTFFPERAGGASFNPKTGDYFVFNKDIGGNEFFQLYRFDMKTGDVTLLTDGKSRNTGGAWSNSGDRLAYTSTRRTGRDTDIYVVNPADPKNDRLVLQVEGGGWGVTDWSPDDRRLVVGEYVSANESYIWLADAATGEKTLVTPKGGAEKVAYGGMGFSRDGRGLYVTTDKDSEFKRLAYLDPATGRHDYLTTHINWDVDSFVLSRDGKTIAFVTNEDGISRLRLLDTSTRRERRVEGLPDGVIGGLEWHENSRDLGFSLSSARSTSDVYSVDVRTGKVERWTESEAGGLNTAQLAEPRLVRWKSFDGREISGFLYVPPARFTGPRPVMISIHGGPESQARPGFLGRTNYFIEEMGVAVIYPNVRGSSGYGKTFLALDNGYKREDTYKDIGALLDWIAAQPNLDKNRVMVTGGSYGGHMSFAVATLYNDRIAATLPVVGISNFVSFLERTEGYRRDLRRVEYGDERDPKMREFMTRIAPLNNASKISKPIFIVQGGNDPRVPLNEAEQMVATVRKNNTPVWYLMAKDEGHGFNKKRNQDFQFYSTIMFMREYLLK
ncbi:MAG TPA: prolyl oligopeptidase family serine peptidase [Pyrinomonadaceae bacterium]|nr:prolyl oligopeptidase family serine peptidase [Pyrinomonadaceae bacterium]